MPQSWKYARVDFDAQTALAVGAKLIGWAAMGSLGPGRGPGLTQSEAVQFAASLASLRHVAASSDEWSRVAVYGPGGQYRGTRIVNASSDWSEEETYLPIVGESPLPSAIGLFGGTHWTSATYADRPLPGWPRLLCLATDRLLTQIAQAEQGGEVPEGYGAEPILGGYQPAALPIGAIAVIVGGAAVAVIGGLAVWRYLDPDVRIRAAAIDASLRSYQARLATAQVTGIMPDASPIEIANAAAVKAAADEQQQRYWLIGAAGVLGIAGGAAGLAYVRRDAA